MYKYLIIKCKELNDQWETDADRTVVCLTNDYNKFNKFGYEIYEIKGPALKLVKEYNA
jgi:hypothetical protein